MVSEAVKLEIGQAVEAGIRSKKNNNRAVYRAACFICDTRKVENLKAMPVPERNYFADSWTDHRQNLLAAQLPGSQGAHYLSDAYSALETGQAIANYEEQRNH